MPISHETKKNEFWIRIIGDFDLYEAPELKQTFDRLQEQRFSLCVVDLSEAESVDSSGLGALLHGAEMAKRTDTPLKLIAARPEIKNLISMANLDSMLPLYDSL